MMEKILVVDDEPSNRNILRQELTHRGFGVELATGGREALARVEAIRPALMILDVMMPDMSGLEVLRVLRANGNEMAVIMVTAFGSIDRAVEAIKAGAFDFITRPCDPDHLEIIIRKALERQSLKRDVSHLAGEMRDRYRLIVGASETMRVAAEMAKRAAASSATVLLLGESGTGKELFARFVHHHSERANRPFVAINSVGLSKELLESELFGHEPGAFTGAQKLKKGKVELADGGTIFFDEIGDISRDLQARLLRFLQEREFERVGGTAPIAVDVRVIAATNRDLRSAVRKGEFRDDLYHRLNVVAITLPPLRERREDIATLAEYFLGKFAATARRNVVGFSEQAHKCLLAYDWPGNVRELANTVERAVVLGTGTMVGVEDLPVGLGDGTASEYPLALSYHDGVNAARRQLVAKALRQSAGNRAAAARLLGLESKYFLKLMKSLGIE